MLFVLRYCSGNYWL